MIKINLLPEEIQEKGKGMDWIILGFTAIVIFTSVSIGSYIMKLESYNRAVKKKMRWERQLAQIKTKVTEVEELDAQKNILNTKKNTVVGLLQGRILYPRFMDLFCSYLPEDIWVTDITLSEAESKNLQVVVLSKAVATEAIAKWLETLEKQTDRFSGISLSAIDLQSGGEPGKPSVYSFSMTFTYRPPEEHI
jgi:Tfp pilus assembly protein PilN